MADDLRPTYTAPGCLPELQAEDMRELRRLRCEGRSGLRAIGALMFARDDPTRGLVHRDVATATERSEREVAEIIEEHRQAHIRCTGNGVAAAARHAA
jgi:predicted HTH transcriptional regulator